MKLLKTIYLDKDNNLEFYYDLEIYLVINQKYYDKNLNQIEKLPDTKELNYDPLSNPLGIIKESNEPVKRLVYYDVGNYRYKYPSGKLICDYKYSVANDFYYNFAVVAPIFYYDSGYRYEFNYIDVFDKFLSKENFSYCYDFTKYNTALAITLDNIYAVVTKKGLIQKYPQYNIMLPVADYGSNDYRFLKYSFKKEEDEDITYGLYDLKDCSIPLPPKYKDFYPYGYSNDYVHAKTLDDKMIVINRLGEELDINKYIIYDFYEKRLVIDQINHILYIYDSEIDLKELI